jgi:ser/thr/tyr protein kinase RAD53
LKTGFVYRHTAAGPPTTGLYAHYDLSTELGKGSFATVMKAISRATGKWYAVKMIHDKSVRSPGEQYHGPNSKRASFAREISIMENLKHPNICELKEVFYQEDNNDISALKVYQQPLSVNISFFAGLVLELVEGGDLLEHILSRNGLRKSILGSGAPDAITNRLSM